MDNLIIVENLKKKRIHCIILDDFVLRFMFFLFGLCYEKVVVKFKMKKKKIRTPTKKKEREYILNK